jgi:hypothetical protein
MISPPPSTTTKFGMVVWQIMLATVATVAVVTGQPSPDAATELPTDYEGLAESIIQHAQQAARHFNTGDKAKAEAAMATVEKVYERAVAINPAEPQAYANMAQFCHNTNQLERAVNFWKLTLSAVKGDGQMEAMVRGRIKFSTYGMHSKARDDAYADGCVRALVSDRQHLGGCSRHPCLRSMLAAGGVYFQCCCCPIVSKLLHSVVNHVYGPAATTSTLHAS